MSFDYRLLANPYINTLIPYQPGKPIEELERELGIVSAIKLASNENALGPSPDALIAAQDALLKSHYYPDGSCFELKKTLAQFLNVHANQLTFGNGSENILEMIIKAYLTREDSAVISEYAFLTIPLLIQSYGAEIIQVKSEQYRHDITKMIAAVTKKTRIVFIVNPNNPTGTYISHDELNHLLESISADILVVVDEAYYEYSDAPDYPNTIKLLNTYPNLLITRTFSKVYGLAALRLGYSISSPAIADMLNRARLPFNVNSIAAIAARAALLDQNHVKRTIEMNTLGKKLVEQRLTEMNMDYIPSLGNFITIHVKQPAQSIYQDLLHQGVIVRPLSAYDLPEHLRVTIGTEQQNIRFLESFQYVMEK